MRDAMANAFMIALFALLQLMVLAGVYEIFYLGFSQQVHCTIDSEDIYLRKWTDHDGISQYRLTASFRVNKHLFHQNDTYMDPHLLPLLFHGYNDTAKEHNVRLHVKDELYGEGGYGLKGTFVADGYQLCYVKSGEYSFTRPNDPDVSVIGSTCLVAMVDVFIFAYCFYFGCLRKKTF